VIEISDNGKHANGNAAKKLKNEQLDHNLPPNIQRTWRSAMAKSGSVSLLFCRLEPLPTFDELLF
jgi:hypothetical protein